MAIKTPINGDEQFLRDLVAKNQNIKLTDLASGKEMSADEALALIVDENEADKQQANKPQANKDKELNAALSRGERAAIREKRRLQGLQKSAERINAASTERIEREKRREQEIVQERQQREADAKQARSIRNFRHVAHDVNQSFNSSVQPALQKIGSLPAPGGIGLMVGILAMLLFVVVRVNAAGDTRLKLLWYSMNGRTRLIGAVKPDTGSHVGGIGDLTPGPGGTLLGPGIKLPNPDGSCPTGYHQIRGSAGNLLCQQDAPKGGGGPSTSSSSFSTSDSLYRGFTTF